MDFSFLPERFKLLKQIGRGGMSTIYLADEQELGRQVALKMLHPILSGDPKNRARLKREARAIAQLDHQNIVRVFNYLESGENCCIVMEYIDGITLDQFIQKHPITLPEIALALFIPMAKGVYHFHQKGITHRDIKPENVMITHDGIVKITDFGIASVSEDHNALTATGSIMGSPLFMSPEHLNSHPIDHQSDIFSLGILLYHILTGELPFTGKNTAQILQQLSQGQYQPIQQRNPAISNGIAKIVQQAMAYNRQQRYPSLLEMISEIEYYFKSLNLDPDLIRTSFLKKYDAYTTELKEKVLNTYYEKMRFYYRQKQFAKAIDYIRLTLHYDPEDQEAQEYLKKLERQIPRWFLPTATILLLIITLLIVLITKEFKDKPEHPDIFWKPFTATLTPTIKWKHVEVNLKKMITLRSDITKIHRTWIMNQLGNILLLKPQKKRLRSIVHRKPRRRKHVRPKIIPVKKINFKLPVRILPKAAEVLLDGKPYGYAAMLHSIPMKTNTPTTLTVRSKGCYTLTKKLNFKTPQKQPEPLRLRWKPARLTIKNPKRHMIYLNNKFRSQGKKYEYIEKLSPRSNGRKIITLRVISTQNRSIIKERITLRAGENLIKKLP